MWHLAIACMYHFRQLSPKDFKSTDFDCSVLFERLEIAKATAFCLFSIFYSEFLICKYGIYFDVVALLISDCKSMRLFFSDLSVVHEQN